MNVWHAVVLSLLQGAFELFPVSSLGHTVLVPALLGWDEHQSEPSFLAFVVVLHLGTAAALLIFFWRDWYRIIAAVLRSIVRRELSTDPDERLGWLIVAGSVPAGVLGLLFKGPLNDLFGHPWIAATCLVLNGFVLPGGERLRRSRGASDGPERADGQVGGPRPSLRPSREVPLATLGLLGGFGIGAAQAMALLPGFSRSGTTMVGGLLLKLSHIDAAKFSFMLATPLILAAGLLAVPDLFKANSNVGPGLAVMGFFISGVTAFLAVRFLMQYFQTERLDIFGYYCMVLGGGGRDCSPAARGALYSSPGSCEINLGSPSLEPGFSLQSPSIRRWGHLLAMNERTTRRGPLFTWRGTLRRAHRASARWARLGYGPVWVAELAAQEANDGRQRLVGRLPYRNRHQLRKRGGFRG